MHYEYDEALPPVKKAILITGFTVIRADSPGMEEISLNLSDGTVVNGGAPNFQKKRNKTLKAGSIKSLSKVLQELYDALVVDDKLPPGQVK